MSQKTKPFTPITQDKQVKHEFIVLNSMVVGSNSFWRMNVRVFCGVFALYIQGPYDGPMLYPKLSVGLWYQIQNELSP
jgi:hypothetical protein